MKKTIVAAAVAAVFAAPVAMADVSISGNVYFEAGEFDDNSGTTADSMMKTRTDIKFAASEDLGNGLKAGAAIVMTADDQADSIYDDKYLTLDGDMFSIKAGNFETYMESHVGAMAANDASHDVSNEISNGEYGVTDSGQTVALTIKPMAGVSIGFQHADNSDTVYAEYSNGGLLVRVANENNANANDTVGLGVQYTMDGLTVKAVTLDDDDGNAPAWFGASYTMGANTIAASVVDGGSTDGDTTLSLSHALSKSTNVYLVMGTDDGTAAADETVVGIAHKF
jgi:hypothetical protein